MWYLCKCGASKNAPPYKSNLTKPFSCEKCRVRINRIMPLRAIRKPADELISVMATKAALFRKFTRKST